MHPYRTHTCGELMVEHVGEIVRLSGWLHRKRDHGNLLFVDLRDHYGITQCVIESDNPLFQIAEQAKLESIVTVTGHVLKRSNDTINKHLITGYIEVKVDGLHIESECQSLPLIVNSDAEFPEETRLKYRFLDLRRQKMHSNIVLRSKIIESLRRSMVERGFLEIQTPILTASSPEGARDYVVPSRVYPGQFYALPQAPQQFKQLLMISGFDKYFQIAPCFRDEDARADRSPGEFYQLDFEMAFATQEDVFHAIEPVLWKVFKDFSSNKHIADLPFPRIPYDIALQKYGTDKPDLRNPIEMVEITDIFKDSDFSLFRNLITKGAIVQAIPAPNAASQSRRFYDHLDGWAKENGAGGLGYIIFEDGNAKGPIAKFLSMEKLETLRKTLMLSSGDAVFFVCDLPKEAYAFSGKARTKIGELLDIIATDSFRFCWVVDFPMYEYDEKTSRIVFSHNPFSMPQGGMITLENQDPLSIKAYQYDIVCNGVELSSGAIRNHLPELMYKAFSIAGYSRKEVQEKFGGMITAFHHGAPPHGGCAPGIDRIVMLLSEEPNIREVIAFPMNQQAQDLLMGAPASIPQEHLEELHLRIINPDKKKNH